MDPADLSVVQGERERHTVEYVWFYLQILQIHGAIPERNVQLSGVEVLDEVAQKPV